MASDSENMILLQSLMGDDFDPGIAKKALMKHKGDIEAAAAAILDKEQFDDEVLPSYSHSGGLGLQNTFNKQRPNTPVGGLSTNDTQTVPSVIIDLTADNEEDSELNRALELSLGTVSQSSGDPVFKRSDRPPDPNWAVVPSNVPTMTNLSSEDQSLAQAIEASLNTSIEEDKYYELQGEDRIRQDHRPVMMRVRDPSLCYAALVLQMLFFVPQVRMKLARWRPDPSALTMDTIIAADAPESIPWTMLGLFTYMDLAVLSYIAFDEAVKVFQPKHASNITDPPGNPSREFYQRIALAIESALDKSAMQSDVGEHKRLFHLRYVPPSISFNSSPTLDLHFDTACVQVNINAAEDANDLVSCLSHLLGLGDVSSTTASISSLPQPSLFEPSDVIAFNLVRCSESQTRQQLPQPRPQEERGPFHYPKYVFLDQFLKENAELAAEKRSTRRNMCTELEILIAKRESLVRFEGRDSLKSLEATVYYYETVASKGGSPDRIAQKREMAIRLKKILVKIENEVQSLDSQIARLRTAADKIFDDPLLRKHRYDLRAVLVHDGLYGRNHIYSFVQHDGRWWKIVDYLVTEVSEEAVLEDSTGLHLGAGPYMLVYSRAVPNDSLSTACDWPVQFQASVQGDNADFLEKLNPDVVARLRSTRILAEPRDGRGVELDTSENATVKSEGTSRAEVMDVT